MNAAALLKDLSETELRRLREVLLEAAGDVDASHETRLDRVE